MDFRLESAVALGSIHIANYERTPSRGVGDFELFLENYLIYKVPLSVRAASVRGNRC